MNNPALKRNIMRRVYLVFLVRTLKNPVTLKTGTIIILGGTTLMLVSIKDIMINAPWTDPMYLYTFSTHAFMHTEMTVKLLSMGVLASCIWITQSMFSTPTTTNQRHFAHTS